MTQSLEDYLERARILNEKIKARNDAHAAQCRQLKLRLEAAGSLDEAKAAKNELLKTTAAYMFDKLGTSKDDRFALAITSFKQNIEQHHAESKLPPEERARLSLERYKSCKEEPLSIALSIYIEHPQMLDIFAYDQETRNRVVNELEQERNDRNAIFAV